MLPHKMQLLLKKQLNPLKMLKYGLKKLLLLLMYSLLLKMKKSSKNN